jgi:heavy metal sensor kinase
MRLTSVSVRARLTLWHAAVMGLVLAAFALGIYVFVRESLFAQIDARLDENLATIAGTARANPMELDEIERHTRVLAFRVVENDWPLYASGGWIAGDLDAADPPPGAGRWIIASKRGGIYHLKEKLLAVNERQFLITTAEQGEQIHRGLYRLGLTLLVGYPVTLILSLLGGYMLAGRALNPLQDITARARSISADNLSERLSVSNPKDELGQLTAVLNDAFARLEEAFHRLKRFTQDAAHELRTPLAVIRSVGEVGLQEQRDSTAYREVIGSMLEEVDRLGHLVDGLLTLARAEAGRLPLNPQPENLRALCQDVVECLRVLAEDKRQTLTFDAPEGLSADVDRHTLRLALMNLVANAIRFTQAGGEIRVNLHHRKTNAVIEVRDNGPGIPQEHHARLFERFYRADASRSHQTGGAGLGLAIARWAVEANGGRIELDSKPWLGSAFRVVLPRTQSPALSPNEHGQR